MHKRNIRPFRLADERFLPVNINKNSSRLDKITAPMSVLFFI
jgi:hypothetical protein